MFVFETLVGNVFFSKRRVGWEIYLQCIYAKRFFVLPNIIKSRQKNSTGCYTIICAMYGRLPIKCPYQTLPLKKKHASKLKPLTCIKSHKNYICEAKNSVDSLTIIIHVNTRQWHAWQSDNYSFHTHTHTYTYMYLDKA